MKKLIERLSSAAGKTVREDDDKDLPWGYTVDGWNEDDLDEAGLIELIEKVERLAYEIRNARRGSYAKFGKTIEDLADETREIGKLFEKVAKEIDSRSEDAQARAWPRK